MLCVGEFDMSLRVHGGKGFELKVEAKVEKLEVIGEFIKETMKKLGMEDEVFQVQLAVDEACSNIIQHAYSGDTENTIRITCSVVGNDFIIKIRDWGKPFDPHSVPPPDLKSELAERRVGGLGIFLMRQVMNEVRYVFYDKMYNELTMIKHLPQKD